MICENEWNFYEIVPQFAMNLQVESPSHLEVVHKHMASNNTQFVLSFLQTNCEWEEKG